MTPKKKSGNGVTRGRCVSCAQRSLHFTHDVRSFPCFRVENAPPLSSPVALLTVSHPCRLVPVSCPQPAALHPPRQEERGRDRERETERKGAPGRRPSSLVSPHLNDQNLDRSLTSGPDGAGMLFICLPGTE